MMAKPSDDRQHGDHLRMRRRVNGTEVVIQVAGELDLVTAPGLVGELTTAMAQATPSGTVVVDLTEVTFMGSVGLGILIEHHRLCRDRDVALRVVAGNRTIARTITITGLDNALAVFATLTDALAPSRPVL